GSEFIPSLLGKQKRPLGFPATPMGMPAARSAALCVEIGANYAKRQQCYTQNIVGKPQRAHYAAPRFSKGVTLLAGSPRMISRRRLAQRSMAAAFSGSAAHRS